MSFYAHLALVIISIIFFIASFIKQRRSYQIVFAIWVATTLLKYISNDEMYLMILGVIQILFFLVSIVLLFRNKNKTSNQTYRQLLEFDKNLKDDKTQENITTEATIEDSEKDIVK